LYENFSFAANDTIYVNKINIPPTITKINISLINLSRKICVKIMAINKVAKISKIIWEIGWFKAINEILIINIIFISENSKIII